MSLRDHLLRHATPEPLPPPVTPEPEPITMQPAAPAVPKSPERPVRPALAPRSLSDPAFLRLRTRIQDALSTEDGGPLDPLPVITQIVESDPGIPPLDRPGAAQTLVDEILGYGPIQALLDDPDVSEIMINGPGRIYIEQAGTLLKTDVSFRDAMHLRSVLEKMLSFTGRRVDESSPMVDARLPDGSRLNAVLSPVMVSGDSVTIRKFAKDPFVLSQLVAIGTLSAAMAEFIQAAVQGKLSVVVSGGTGSGKTTTLNALSAFIPAAERIVTIEDAAELQLQQDHVLRMEARPPNIEGQGGIPIRALVRNALRMRPDRIIVGEVRGGETLDMLQAMNTGHEGSLTTVHANSPRDALSRMETMVLMAGADLPLPAIRTQIASAVDLIVQQARLLDGTRRIIRITEVVGMEGDVITTQDLFQFDQTGVDPDSGSVTGSYRGCGIRPSSFERLQSHGITLDPGLFTR